MRFLAQLPEAAIWALIGLGVVAVGVLVVGLICGAGMVLWDAYWDLGGVWADLKRRIFPSQRNH